MMQHVFCIGVCLVVEAKVVFFLHYSHGLDFYYYQYKGIFHSCSKSRDCARGLIQLHHPNAVEYSHCNLFTYHFPDALNAPAGMLKP